MREMILEALVEKGYGIFPHFMVQDEVTALQQICKDHWLAGQFHEAKIGAKTEAIRHGEIRSDAVMWLDDNKQDSVLQHYFQQMQLLKQMLNQNLYLGLTELEAHFAVYPIGAFYKKHLDCFRQNNARAITVILYLNQNWQPNDGGQLRLYLDEAAENYLDIAPEMGTLVVFRSEQFWHEVLPAKVQRQSITGWFLQNIGSPSWI